MPSPLLLDLCCGPGGAGTGYSRAGFRVIGIDIRPQPRYPFPFILADAMTWPIRGVDAVHASVPCQRFSKTRGLQGNDHPDLLTPMREKLKETGLPWVIENVPGAPMRTDFKLCGCQFSLGSGNGQLRRQRWFEVSWVNSALAIPCNHDRPAIPVFGHNTSQRKGYPCWPAEARREAMGINWTTAQELSQTIPPAFTEYIGAQLIQAC